MACFRNSRDVQLLHGRRIFRLGRAKVLQAPIARQVIACIGHQFLDAQDRLARWYAEAGIAVTLVML
jgi:hypothetical protein